MKSQIKTEQIHTIYNDPKLSAKVAGLLYVPDSGKGYSRLPKGTGKNMSFDFKNTKGKQLSESEEKRVKALVLPPAWTHVWIAPKANAHLQATGIDKKGIKQYRYHHKWTELREILKFYRLIHFAEILPKLRRALKKEIKTSKLSKEKVLAAMLMLMDELSLRIGNEAYAESNKTYGITTLRNRHAKVTGNTIHLHFVGKSHQDHDVSIKDASIAKVVKESKALSGEHLFEYIDTHQKIHSLTSHDVNHYIQNIMGHDFTAKDFRTWVGTAHAFELLKLECEKGLKRKEREEAMREVVKKVAKRLGNTAAVCKAHYIHLDLQELFTEGKLLSFLHSVQKNKKVSGLKKHEAELKVILASMYEEKLQKLLKK